LTPFNNEPAVKKTACASLKIVITEVMALNGDDGTDLVAELLLASVKNVLPRLKGDGDFRSEERRSC